MPQLVKPIIRPHFYRPQPRFLNRQAPGGYQLSAVNNQSIMSDAQKQFIMMLKADFPRLYKKAMEAMGVHNNNGLGVHPADVPLTTTQTPGFFQNLLNTVKQIVPIVIQTKAQRDLLNMQMARAKQGLPPLDPRFITSTVQIGVDPATIRQAGTLGFKVAAPFMIGAALIAFMMFGKKRR